MWLLVRFSLTHKPCGWFLFHFAPRGLAFQIRCHFIDQLGRKSFKIRKFSRGLHSLSCQSDQVSCLWPIRLQIVKQTQIFPRFTLGAKHLFTPQLISAAWQPHSKAKGEPFILLTPFCSSDCRACQNAIINLFKLKLSISQQRVNSLDWKQNVETVPCGERLEMLIGCNEGSNVTIPESSMAVWFCTFRHAILSMQSLKCLYLGHTIISWPTKQCYLVLKVLIKRTVQPDNGLILQRNFHILATFGLTERHVLNNSSYLFAILILLWGLLRINSSFFQYVVCNQPKLK